MPDTQNNWSLADSYALTSAHGGTPESRDRVANENRIKIAPLVQASQAAQTRLALFADPNDPSKPVQGHEAEYAAAHDQLADIIGKMRTTLHPPPSNDPHGLRYLADKVSDKLHITNDLVNKAKERQAVKVGNYKQQEAQDVRNTVQSTPMNPIVAKKAAQTNAGFTPEQAQQSAEVDAGISPKFGADNFKTQTITLSDGRTISAQQSTKTGKWQDLNGQQIPEDLLIGARLEKKVSPVKGIAFDTATGQAVNKDTGQRFSPTDSNLPVEVASLFKQQKNTAFEKQQNALKLAYARGAAYQNQRVVQQVDPDNPGDVFYTTAGAAEKSHGLAPGSSAHTAAVGTLNSATFGPIGQEIVAFKTALQHADLLEAAGQALNNGDTRKLNQIANSIDVQFGSDAATNFNTIAGAYTREVTKALAAGHLTDSEIAQNGLNIPTDASPEQLAGAINAYRALMNSKIKMRTEQVKAGLKGKTTLDVDKNSRPDKAYGTVKHGGKTYWVDKEGNNLGEKTK